MLFFCLVSLCTAFKVQRIPSVGTPPSIRSHSYNSFIHENHIYVFGGGLLGELHNDLWKFSLSGNYWERIIYNTPEAPEPREKHALFFLQGKLYVYGGRTANGLTGDMWEFDFEQKAWQKLYDTGETPPPRIRTAVTQSSYKTWIFGGYTEEGFTNELFEFSEGKWKQLENLGAVPKARQNPQIAYWNNKLFAWGGIDEEDYLDNELYYYDLSTSTWSKVALDEKPLGRFLHGMVVREDYLYLIFGWNPELGEDLGDIWKIHLPELSKWEFLVESEYARDGFAMTLKDDSVYMIFGYVVSDYSNAGLKLDLSSMSVQVISPHFLSPPPRKRHSLIRINSELWLFGGQSSESK